MVKGEDSHLSGCGFEPLPRILDGVSEASYYIGKREIKVSKWGSPKKRQTSRSDVPDPGMPQEQWDLRGAEGRLHPLSQSDKIGLESRGLG